MNANPPTHQPPKDAADAQVIIIGAGPIGLLLANLLGNASVRVLVFDKRETPLQSSMAIGVTPPSLEILQRLGLDQILSSEGVQVKYAEVHEAGTKLGRLAFDHIDCDYPFFLSIPQARTVEILRKNLERFPSVTVREGVKFTGLEQTADSVRVALRDVRTETHFHASADFLVGCDGHRSNVCAALGLKAREKTYPQRFIMADFLDGSGLGAEARLFFSSEGSIESFPLPGGWRRWIVQASECRNPAPLQYLTRAVHRLAGVDLSRLPARFVSEFGARRTLVTRYFSGRVVLAGDAAHVMSSIGGQGMNTGFADVEMLAALLPGLLKNPAATEETLAAYDRVRRQAYRVAARRAEQGMWLGTLRGRFASRFRKCVIRDILFSRLVQPRLAPHFAMLTIPYRNLSHVPRELVPQPLN